MNFVGDQEVENALHATLDIAVEVRVLAEAAGVGQQLVSATRTCHRLVTGHVLVVGDRLGAVVALLECTATAWATRDLDDPRDFDFGRAISEAFGVGRFVAGLDFLF